MFRKDCPTYEELMLNIWYRCFGSNVKFMGTLCYKYMFRKECPICEDLMLVGIHSTMQKVPQSVVVESVRIASAAKLIASAAKLIASAAKRIVYTV